MEEGENSQDSAKREFVEETAVDISDRNIKFIGLLPRHTRDGKKVKGMMYVYQLDTDQPIEPDFAAAKDGEEHTEWKYFKLDEIDFRQCGEFMYKLIEIVLQ
jgi:8-oxo-dGTP pyrophosphatase MutT (NUDIX family)